MTWIHFIEPSINQKLHITTTTFKMRSLENLPVCYNYDTSPRRQVTSDSTKNTLDVMANNRSIYFSYSAFERKSNNAVRVHVLMQVMAKCSYLDIVFTLCI